MTWEFTLETTFNLGNYNLNCLHLGKKDTIIRGAIGGGGDRPRGGGDFLGKIPIFWRKKLEKSQILAPQLFLKIFRFFAKNHDF